MNIFEKIEKLKAGHEVFTRTNHALMNGFWNSHLTTDDLKSLVSVIETAEAVLTSVGYGPASCKFCVNTTEFAAEALKTIRTAKGEE